MIDIYSEADFRVRKQLAWKAIIKLFRIWKSSNISREVKINLFRATIESILLYNATTWTMTHTLEKSLDGAYTKLLRYALNIKWSDKITNKELYGDLSPVSVRLRERRLIFAGHCWRSRESAKQPVSELIFWSVPGGVNRPGPKKTYVKVLLEDLGDTGVRKKELADAVEPIKAAMEDRVAWRSRIKRL